MAIKFKINEDENEAKEREQKLQQEENEKALQEGRKPKDLVKNRKRKTAKQKWSNVLLIFSIIAVIYAITYSFSGLIIGLPIAALWIAWFFIVLFVTICTIGLIWLSDDFKSFNSGFMAFNESVVNATEAVTEFMYKIFPYLASFFGFCVIAFLILSINGFKKQQDKKEGYKGKLIWAIVLTALFVIATIFDIIVFTNLAKK